MKHGSRFEYQKIMEQHRPAQMSFGPPPKNKRKKEKETLQVQYVKHILEHNCLTDYW
jgi:hypothetical protein